MTIKDRIARGDYIACGCSRRSVEVDDSEGVCRKCLKREKRYSRNGKEKGIQVSCGYTNYNILAANYLI